MYDLCVGRKAVTWLRLENPCMSSCHRYRAGAFLRRSPAFRALAWLLLAYVLVAALHGMAPGLWAHVFEEGYEGAQGPFRVFMFGVYLPVCLVLVLLVSCAAQGGPWPRRESPPAPVWRLSGGERAPPRLGSPLT